MPAIAFPPPSWTPDHCIAWLEQHNAVDVTDDDLGALFAPSYLDDAMGKAWNPDQPRATNGRWTSGSATGAGRTVGQAYADEQGVGGSHKIVVTSKRVTKYAGHDTVESYVASHPRGRAHALRQLAADHKAGRISFEAPRAAEAAPAPRMKTRVGILHRLDDPKPAATGYAEAKPEAFEAATYKGKDYPGDAAAAALYGVTLKPGHEGSEGYKAVQQRLKLMWNLGGRGDFGPKFHNYLRDAQSTFGRVKPQGFVPYAPPARKH